MPPNMYATKNITFRAYEIQIDLMQKAAEHSGKTLSDWARDLLVPQAARELGVEAPSLPKIERGRYGSMIAKAAKARGMTREEFEEWSAQQVAAQILSEDGSGERPAQAPGRRGLGVYAGAGETTAMRSPRRRTRADAG